MKVIDIDWKKRNGNGQSTCHLCNTLSWDSWCYDFELKILDKELFNTVLCGDCISKIKQEMECKMPSKEEIIEEDKEIKKIKQYYDKDLDEYVVETYINGINYKEIYKSRYDEMMIKKISELIDEVNKLKRGE